VAGVNATLNFTHKPVVSEQCFHWKRGNSPIGVDSFRHLPPVFFCSDAKHLENSPVSRYSDANH